MRIDSLRAWLEVCATRIDLAAAMSQAGVRHVAERWLAEAEMGYAAVLRFVTDPRYRMGDDDRRELAGALERLRKRLDAAWGSLSG